MKLKLAEQLCEDLRYLNEHTAFEWKLQRSSGTGYSLIVDRSSVEESGQPVVEFVVEHHKLGLKSYSDNDDPIYYTMRLDLDPPDKLNGWEMYVSESGEDIEQTHAKVAQAIEGYCNDINSLRSSIFDLHHLL